MYCEGNSGDHIHKQDIRRTSLKPDVLGRSGSACCADKQIYGIDVRVLASIFEFNALH